MKYLTLLRESTSISFGNKFKTNFLKVQALLKQILIDVKFRKEKDDTVSNEIHGTIKELNEKMMRPFDFDIVCNSYSMMQIESQILNDMKRRALAKMLPPKKN